MPISDLTSPDAVEAALAEFDQLGRDAFLKQYGFGRARRYFVSRGGNHYDSKAKVGAAVGFEHPDRGGAANIWLSRSMRMGSASQQRGSKSTTSTSVDVASPCPAPEPLQSPWQ